MSLAYVYVCSVWQSLAGRQMVGLRAEYVLRYCSLHDTKDHTMNRVLLYDTRHM